MIQYNIISTSAGWICSPKIGGRWRRFDPTRQADEGLSHQAGEALVQKWAQESNVDLRSALEIEIFRNQSNLQIVGGDF